MRVLAASAVALLVALCAATTANADYALDGSYGDDGRLVRPVGQIGVGSLGAVVNDRLGRLLVAGRAFEAERLSLAVARVLPSGARDTTFAGGEARFDLQASSLEVVDAAELPSGSLIVAVERIHEQDRRRSDVLVAVTAAGALDPSFGAGGVQEIGQLADGSDVLVADAGGGLLVLEHGHEGVLVRRRTADGAVDAGYGVAGAADPAGLTASAISVAPGGTYPTIAGRTADDAIAVIRLSATGGSDTSFGEDGAAVPVASSCAPVRLAVGGDGRVLAACDRLLAQLTAEGRLDTEFDGDGRLWLESVGGPADVAFDAALRPMVLVGAEIGQSALGRREVRRLLPSGALDPTWAGDGSSPDDPGIRNDARLVALPGGATLVSGALAPIGDERVAYTPPRLARLASDGRLDATFDGDGRALARLGAFSAFAMTGAVPSPAGGARVIGATHFGEEHHGVVLGVTPAGTLDPDWGTGGVVRLRRDGLSVASARTTPDGGLLFAGRGHEAGFVAGRLRADGTPAPDFGHDGMVRVAPEGALGATASSIVPAADGGYFVAGRVRTREVDETVMLAKLTAGGGVDAAYGDGGWVSVPRDVTGAYPGAGGLVASADGTVSFVTEGSNGSTGRVLLHRRGPDGRPDAALGATGSVVLAEGDLALRGLVRDEQRLLVALDRRDRRVVELVAYTPDGRRAAGFGGDGTVELRAPASMVSGTALRVHAMTTDGAGRVLVAGTAHVPFCTACSDRPFAARLLADGTADGTFGPEGFVVGPAADERTPAVPVGIVPQPDGRVVLAGPTGTLHRRAVTFALAERAPAEVPPSPAATGDAAGTSAPAEDDAPGSGPATSAAGSAGAPATPSPVRARRARAPARLKVIRAALRGRRLTVVAALRAGARGTVRVTLRARGRKLRWGVRPRSERLRVRRVLPRGVSPRRARVTLTFMGDARVAPARVSARVRRVGSRGRATRGAGD